MSLDVSEPLDSRLRAILEGKRGVATSRGTGAKRGDGDAAFGASSRAMTDPETPNVAFVSRYPTEKDLDEAMGPPRQGRTREYPSLLFQHEDAPITGWPRKTTNLIATGQGELALETTLQTGKGDTVTLRHELERSDALDLIATLADWVASPDSIRRETPEPGK